ncbi:UNVERIFIED_CONTAM: hypothetical protein Scaly_2192300 [Sesamum calycinum]|uniref:Uncharacterized protein n=1 Tax=Sesamum calycinum TaxID=2727403 RepID=A0AAW2MQ03_9LAMI
MRVITKTRDSKEGEKRSKDKTRKKKEREKNEGKKRLLVAKKSEIKKALFSQQNFVVLVYKEAMLNSNSPATSLRSVATSPLQDYEDVYLNVIPPIRGIEHQIDFMPGASLPNRLANRTNRRRPRRFIGKSKN